MSTSTSTQKTNVLEYGYDFFRMYSSTSTITLECNLDYFHDYFHGYPVSTVKATSMESGVTLFLFQMSPFKCQIHMIKYKLYNNNISNPRDHISNNIQFKYVIYQIGQTE